jgi:hypothetical protein
MKKYNKFGFYIPSAISINTDRKINYNSGPSTKGGLIFGIIVLICFTVGGYYLTTKTGTSNTKTIFTVSSVTPIIQQTGNSVGITFKIIGTTPMCENTPVTLINYNYTTTVGDKIPVWSTPGCTTSSVQTTSSATTLKIIGYFIMLICIIVIILNLKQLLK